jgi:DNA polymerase I-like protein with 3'-5' exonuclease and polymerase domains
MPTRPRRIDPVTKRCRTNHSPSECHEALAGASLAYIDLETTGLGRNDCIVAAGLLIDPTAHILITTEHRDLSSLGLRITVPELKHALEPLASNMGLVAVFHNACFDVAMLERAGIPVRCRIDDTMKLLKLLDSDRGPDRDDGAGGSQQPRYERRYKATMNYKLKDVALHLLNLTAREFPGQPSDLALDTLVRYLRSDLLVTHQLYQHLRRRLSAEDWAYNFRLIAPVTPLLVQMSVVGAQADPHFIDSETERLLQLMRDISNTHQARFGMGLAVGDWRLRGWIYYRGLHCRKIWSGKKRQLSLRTQDILELRREAETAAVTESLELIHDYKLAQSLMRRVRALRRFVDRRTQRIYSSFNDFQASGRVSSTKPNLQQIAGEVAAKKKKEFLSVAFRDQVVQSRNAIVASPGYVLVAFDIAQADIRVLAHLVESFPDSGQRYLDRLQRARVRRVPRVVRKYRKRMWDHFRPENKKRAKCPYCWSRFQDSRGPTDTGMECPVCGKFCELPAKVPIFDPSQACVLAEDFRKSQGDFYTTASERMLGRPPANKTERNHMKQTVLGIVNGMGVPGLAKRLDVDDDTARDYLQKFAEAYPQVDRFTRLMHHAFAITGSARTFGGRHRRITSHWWMVNRGVIDLFLSYKRADKLWARVVPLWPNRHTLTCWVLRVIDTRYGSKNEGKEIYNHRNGRISQARYRFFEDDGLVFGLPVRNISWRIIRRVRTRREEAVYEGFDKARRQLFNHLAQGGTADVVKTMMLHCLPVCERFHARTILQIHDEIVFEVPRGDADRFTRAVKPVLELPPTADFDVPIVVEPKMGERFGNLRELHPDEVSSSWIVRSRYRARSRLKTLLSRIWRLILRILQIR